MKESTDFIFGIRAVIEAIRSEQEINKIMIQKGMEKDLFLELKKVTSGRDYNLQFVPLEKLNKLTQKNHQGVVAFISPISYYSTEYLMEKLISEGKSANFLLLDRITDVRNFGAIARSAECMGVDGIILPKKGGAGITSDAIKTSAGALHKIPVCREDYLQDTLLLLKQYGVKIIACTEKTKKIIADVDFTGHSCIIMGSEEDGISPELMKYCDEKAKIPLAGEIGSFNVSVAAGIVLYEKRMQTLAQE
jgi:23S rRNA (guanosine2251-2'-O)-methyltransferase